MNTREPDTDNTGVGMHWLTRIAAAWLFEFLPCSLSGISGLLTGTNF